MFPICLMIFALKFALTAQGAEPILSVAQRAALDRWSQSPKGLLMAAATDEEMLPATVSAIGRACAHDLQLIRNATARDVRANRCE